MCTVHVKVHTEDSKGRGMAPVSCQQDAPIAEVFASVPKIREQMGSEVLADS